MWLLASFWGMSQESEKKKETEEEPKANISQHLVVTATRTEKELRTVPNTIQLVQADEIAQLNASGSVADLLADVPGLELSDSSVPGAKRVIIRGDGGNRVIILVDGQKVSEQKSMEGVPLMINPADIAQIEVLKGPNSVLYGSDAIGGVVNIITKKPGHQPLSGSLSTGYNSNTEGGSANFSFGGRQGAFSYRIGAGLTDHGDRDTPMGTIDNTDYNHQSLDVKLGYDINAVHLALSYEYFDGEMNSTYQFLEPPMSRFDLELPEWSREKVAFSVSNKRSGHVLTNYKWDFFFQNTYKDFLNTMGFIFAPGMPESLMELRSQNDLDSFGSLLQMDFLFDHHYLIAGLDWLEDDLNALEFDNRTGFGPFPFSSAFAYDTTMSSLAFFMQDEWTLSEQTSLYLGARHTMLDIALESTDNPELTLNENDDRSTVGNLGLVYSPNNRASFRLNVGQGFRYGTLQQLFLGTSHGSSTPTLPNPNLDPETSLSGEIGFRYYHDRLEADLTAYVNHAKDYITTQVTDGVRRFENIDEARTRGLEWNVAYAFPQGFKPYCRGSLMRREFITPAYQTTATGHPEWVGRVGSSFQKKTQTQSWHVDAFARFAAETEESYLVFGEIATDTYSSWVTWNVNTSLRFGKNQRFLVGINAWNLTDKTYLVATEATLSPGRHLILNLGMNF
jgi:hemoglobin/transferrin/lactoferrin receptor protein